MSDVTKLVPKCHASRRNSPKRAKPKPNPTIQGTAPQCWSGEESRVGVSVREKGLAFVGGMSVFKSVEARLRPSKAARAPRWRGLNVNHIVGGWACGPMTKMLRPSQSSHSQSSQRRWRRQNGSWLAGCTVCKGCNNTAVASSVGVGRPRLLGRQRVRRLRHPPLLCGVPQALLSLSLSLSLARSTAVVSAKWGGTSSFWMSWRTRTRVDCP